MIIKKLIVGRFGKLKDINVNLKKGLNIVYGENEAGKSTLQAFIKAMFYGMDSKKKKIRENDRKRFLPWSGENAFGKIYFEDEHKNTYMIQRTFGKRKKEDESAVLDVVTGKNSNHIDQNKPGVDVFGLGEDAFEKTVFVRQLMCKVSKDGENEIMKRLSNLHDSGDEDVYYGKALVYLENTKKDLTNARKTGKIDKLKKDYATYQEQRGKIMQLQEENFEEQVKLNEKIEEKYSLQNKIKALEEEKIQENNLKIYKEYKKLLGYTKQINELSKEKEEIINLLYFNENVIDQSFIDEIKEKNTIYMQEKKRYKEVEDNKKLIKKSIDKKLKALYRKLQINLKGVLIIGVFTILLSFIFGWMKNSYLYVLSIFGVFMCIYALSERKNITSTIQSIKKEMILIQENIQIEKNQLRNLEAEIIKKINLICQETIKIDDVESFIHKFTKMFNRKLELEAKIFSLKDIYKDLVQDRDIKKMKKVYESFVDIQMYEGIKKEKDEEKIEDSIREKQQKLLVIEKEIKDVEHSIETRFYKKKTVLEIEEEIERSKEKIKQHEENVQALKIASEVLKDSFKEIQRSFGPKLNKTVGDILSSITDNRYEDIKISEDYEVKIKDPINNQIKDIAYFSNGTLDQIYFAFRLGIIHLIFDKIFEIPFILDDAFVQYDDYRLDAVLKYLYQYAKQRQVILFTCQNREIEKLKAFSDINIINL